MLQSALEKGRFGFCLSLFAKSHFDMPPVKKKSATGGAVVIRIRCTEHGGGRESGLAGAEMRSTAKKTPNLLSLVDAELHQRYMLMPNLSLQNREVQKCEFPGAAPAVGRAVWLSPEESGSPSHFQLYIYPGPAAFPQAAPARQQLAVVWVECFFPGSI